VPEENALVTGFPTRLRLSYSLIYTHVLQQGGRGALSPLDLLEI
jgi:hypothetical protein